MTSAQTPDFPSRGSSGAPQVPDFASAGPSGDYMAPDFSSQGGPSGSPTEIVAVPTVVEPLTPQASPRANLSNPIK